MLIGLYRAKLVRDLEITNALHGKATHVEVTVVVMDVTVAIMLTLRAMMGADVPWLGILSFHANHLRTDEVEIVIALAVETRRFCPPA